MYIHIIWCILCISTYMYIHIYIYMYIYIYPIYIYIHTHGSPPNIYMLGYTPGKTTSEHRVLSMHWRKHNYDFIHTYKALTKNMWTYAEETFLRSKTIGFLQFFFLQYSNSLSVSSNPLFLHGYIMCLWIKMTRLCTPPEENNSPWLEHIHWLFSDPEMIVFNWL